MTSGVYIRDFGQVQYSEAMFFPPDSSCEVCGAIDCRRVVDHCHRHGWVRGVVCNRCNHVLRGVDRGAASGFALHRALAQLSRLLQDRLATRTAVLELP